MKQGASRCWRARSRPCATAAGFWRCSGWRRSRATSRRPPTSRRRPAAAGDMAAFEAEWMRMGGVLHDRLAAPRGDALAAVSPAPCARSARPRCRRRGVYYDASLEYGRNTLPRTASSTSGRPGRRGRSWTSAARSRPRRGGSRRPSAARGRRSRRSRARCSLPTVPRRRSTRTATSSRRAPRSRRRASSTRWGCDTAPSCATSRPRSGSPLWARPSRPTRPGSRSGCASSTCSSPPAECRPQPRAALPGARPGGAGRRSPRDRATAAAIAGEVLPRYFAALAPATPAPPQAEPRVTVTLVRWPYT